MSDKVRTPPEGGAISTKFPALEDETRPRVPTAQAAFYLAYAPQTMRDYYARGKHDPRLKPIKVGNRILWDLAGIRTVLEVQ